MVVEPLKKLTSEIMESKKVGNFWSESSFKVILFVFSSKIICNSFQLSEDSMKTLKQVSSVLRLAFAAFDKYNN